MLASERKKRFVLGEDDMKEVRAAAHGRQIAASLRGCAHGAPQVVDAFDLFDPESTGKIGYHEVRRSGAGRACGGTGRQQLGNLSRGRYSSSRRPFARSALRPRRRRCCNTSKTRTWRAWAPLTKSNSSKSVRRYCSRRGDATGRPHRPFAPFAARSDQVLCAAGPGGRDCRGVPAV